MSTHHIVHVLPVVEGDELKSGQHRPQEVIEVGVTVVGVFPHLETEVARLTVPRPCHIAADHRFVVLLVHQPVILVVHPPEISIHLPYYPLRWSKVQSY